jgi:hypothetical protein
MRTAGYDKCEELVVSSLFQRTHLGIAVAGTTTHALWARILVSARMTDNAWTKCRGQAFATQAPIIGRSMARELKFEMRISNLEARSSDFGFRPEVKVPQKEKPRHRRSASSNSGRSGQQQFPDTSGSQEKTRSFQHWQFQSA